MKIRKIKKYKAPKYKGMKIICAGFILLDELVRGENCGRKGDTIEENVGDFMELIKNGDYDHFGYEPPMVEYINGEFVMCTGNHRYLAHARTGQKEIFVCVVKWIDEDFKECAMSVENKPKVGKPRTGDDAAHTASRILQNRLKSKKINEINHSEIKKVLDFLQFGRGEGDVRKEAEKLLLEDHEVKNGIKSLGAPELDEIIAGDSKYDGVITSRQVFTTGRSTAGGRALLAIIDAQLEAFIAHKENGTPMPEEAVLVGSITNVYDEDTVYKARKLHEKNYWKDYDRMMQRIEFLQSGHYIHPDFEWGKQVYGKELNVDAA